MKKKSSFVTAILIAALLAGALLLLYPTVSDYWNSFHQSRAIASYAEQVADLDDNMYDQIWADARAYNKTLDNSTSRFVMTEEQKKIYEALCTVHKTGTRSGADLPARSIAAL